jgi:hypothetical protein
VFIAKNCASCHGGSSFTKSAGGSGNPENIGTINVDSGSRLLGSLNGIDVPTLRDAWATPPYLHRGQAGTIADAILAHSGLNITETELADLAAYVSQIGNQETSAPTGTGGSNGGTGLTGRYFNNTTLTGSSVLQRVENIAFKWTGSPGPGVNTNNFSVRWTGQVEASATGSFRFQTRTDAGVRLWINGNLVVDNWTSHVVSNDVTGVIALNENQRYAVVMEFYDTTADAVAKLYWQPPGEANLVAIPVTRLYAN